MSLWKKAAFKGKDVWIEVQAEGSPVQKLGRVAMRYSKSPNAKLYRANLDNLEFDPGSAPVDLPDGMAADSKQKAAKKKKGFGKAGNRTAAQTVAARQDAAAKLAALGADVAIAFTDGGCRGNPGPAGSGVVLKLPGGRTAEVARSLGRGTNNIAELTAIQIAIELLDEAEWPADAPCAVFSDSSYSAGVLVKGWKAKKNVKLIVELREQLAARPGIELVWVAGHAGITGNERADALATAGVNGASTKTWAD